MSQRERDIIAQKREYAESGPGKIEAILNMEMTRMYEKMEEQIKAMDEEYLTKANPPKR